MRISAVSLVLSAVFLGCKSEPPHPAPLDVAPSAVASPAGASAAAPPASGSPASGSRMVAIDKLLGTYKDNEVRGDLEYKGKVVRVSGVIGDIKKDALDNIYVTVGTGQQLEIPQVQCFIAKGEEKLAAQLSKGNKVTVQGSVDGLMMNVIMKDCQINPMAKLCDRLRSAVGGKRCSANLETGDAQGITLDGDGNTGSGGALFCARDAEHYARAVEEMSKQDTVIGSPKALCFGVFFGIKAGKNGALPDDWKPKLQAFFDGL